MNLAVVSVRLAALNNGDRYNQERQCEPIAVLAADALVNNTFPAPGSGLNSQESPIFGAERRLIPELLVLPPDQERDRSTRASKVWRWLKSKAKRGVYVFAQDKDHCYDFVVDGDVFLIDASQQIYRRINTPGEASFFYDLNSPYAPGFHTGKKGNYPVSNTTYGFNYISPQPRKDDDMLRIFYWGDLHPFFR